EEARERSARIDADRQGDEGHGDHDPAVEERKPHQKERRVTRGLVGLRRDRPRLSCWFLPQFFLRRVVAAVIDNNCMTKAMAGASARLPSAERVRTYSKLGLRI